jgi:hypothetical protein
MKKTLGTLLKIFVGGLGVGFAEYLCIAFRKLGIRDQYKASLEHENEILLKNNNALRRALAELDKESES